ncbi:PREDICTED: PC-esterase domain-containing protein 1A-like [Nanorana parkeri]|uniref:PC-esterase domain-containing protein 1A-like n=1 Tax=Nanorana parkeri TaxID=125878 RepID=UPI00085444FF|nr:PREDICTED: PC-esterase domain-containing protein 1A-like [Nanorana parkeri]
MSFANDVLVEGGSLSEMHNGITYREVRQYRTGYHLVRFYFLTRIYSEYVESVLADFKEGPQPDVLILNSCIWDLIRYDYQPLEFYKTNLDRLFCRLTEVLPPECLVIWNMTMPVGFKDGEVQEVTRKESMGFLRWDIIEGNFYSATLANLHKMDVMDMHYHFRFDLRARTRDSIHWNQLAHRKYTQILMSHIAQAWGVQAPETPIAKCHPIKSVPPVGLLRKVPLRRPPFNDQENSQHHFGHFIHAAAPPPVVSLRNVPHFPPQENRNHFGPMFLPGYTSFDDNGDSDMIGQHLKAS